VSVVFFIGEVQGVFLWLEDVVLVFNSALLTVL